MLRVFSYNTNNSVVWPDPTQEEGSGLLT